MLPFGNVMPNDDIVLTPPRPAPHTPPNAMPPDDESNLDDSPFESSPFESSPFDDPGDASVWIEESPPPRGENDWGVLAAQIGELSHAGLPLPLTLRTAAANTTSHGRAQTLRYMADRLDDGVDLPTVIRESDLPNVSTLAAALEAGHRSGDLYSILQPVVYAERIRQSLKRRLRSSLMYPYMVVAVGFVLATGILGFCYRVFDRFAADMKYDPTTQMPIVSGVLIAIPIVLLLIATIEVLRTIGSGKIPFAWWAPVRETERQLVYYSFVSHLAILVESHVPLPEALSIAGEVAGGNASKEADALADGIRSGRSFEEMSHHFQSAPHIVRTMLGSLAGPSGEHHEQRRSSRLLPRLQQSAEMLVDSIEARLDRFERTRMFCVVLILGFGVMGYALFLFWPLVHAYSQVSLDPALLG